MSENWVRDIYMKEQRDKIARLKKKQQTSAVANEIQDTRKDIVAVDMLFELGKAKQQNS